MTVFVFKLIFCSLILSSLDAFDNYNYLYTFFLVERVFLNVWSASLDILYQSHHVEHFMAQNTEYFGK